MTRLLPEDDFVSLQNYGVQMYELKDKHYIYWNFEKSPRLAKEHESPGTQFDVCGKSVLLVFCVHSLIHLRSCTLASPQEMTMQL